MGWTASRDPNLTATHATSKGFSHLHKNKTIAGIVMVLLLLLFGFGVTHLFILRFESGDVYPAYSSLRSDPLGTRGLYESLANLDTVAVQRNYDLRQSITFEPQTTFFYLGASAGDFDSVPEAMMKVFDRLTQSGGRLVVTFLPVTKKQDQKALEKQDPVQEKADTGEKDDSLDKPNADKRRSAGRAQTKNESPGLKSGRPSKKDGPGPTISIKKHWGLDIEYKESLPVKDDKRLAIEAVSNRRGLPSFISWHSNLYFELDDDAWQTVYSFDGLPLIVERPYGKGSIVACADSYFMSNEALIAERHTGLLVWLIGGHANLVFDEAHLGLFEQPSVAQLIRNYRFHWFFAALAALAFLYVWKCAVYFIPPPTENSLDDADVVSEKDYIQGLIALLRRNFACNQILEVCAREWERTFKKNRRIRPATVERVIGLAETGLTDSKQRKDPVEEYQKISKLIAEE
jgi:hypothetical protein